MQESVTKHSPWEMFPANSESSSDAEYAALGVDSETHARLLGAVEACLAQDEYRLFTIAPEPTEYFPLASGGTARLYFLQCKDDIWEVPSSVI